MLGPASVHKLKQSIDKLYSESHVLLKRKKSCVRHGQANCAPLIVSLPWFVLSWLSSLSTAELLVAFKLHWVNFLTEGFIFCLPVFVVKWERGSHCIHLSIRHHYAGHPGFIVCVPFIPHCSDWSSFDWSVLSSWEETTVFDLHLSIGGSTLGRAFIASSVGALVMCRKLIFTILWRNNLQYSHIWPLMSINKNALFRMQRLVQCRLPRYWHCRWEKGLWMVSSFRRCNRSLAAILQRRVMPAFGSIARRDIALAPHLVQNVWQLDPWCHIWT